MPTVPTLIVRAVIITALTGGAAVGVCAVVHSWRQAHAAGLERLNRYRFAQKLAGRDDTRRAGGR